MPRPVTRRACLAGGSALLSLSATAGPAPAVTQAVAPAPPADAPSFRRVYLQK